MTELLLKVPFSATHQILIQGELEPVHGHEFRAHFAIEVDDQRDVSCLEPVVLAVIAPLRATHLAAVAVATGGRPSAERIAAYLYQRVNAALVDHGAKLREAAVTEAVGCEAVYRE